MKKTILIFQMFLFAFVFKTYSQTQKQSDPFFKNENSERTITRDVPYRTMNNGKFSMNKSGKDKTRLSDPFLTCFPEKTEKLNDWNIQASKMLKKKNAKAKKFTLTTPPIIYNEIEQQFENTNDRDTPETIPGFGNADNLNNRANINGVFNVKVANVTEVPKKKLDAMKEDNGSADLAIPIVLSEDRIETFVGAGVIGDGPHGSAGTGAGDHDYFLIDLGANDILKITVTATDPEHVIFPNVDVLIPFESGFGETTLLGVADVIPFFEFYTDRGPELIRSTEKQIELTYRTPGSFSGIHYIDLYDSHTVNFEYTTEFDPATSTGGFTLSNVQDHFVSGDELGSGNEGSYEIEVTVIKGTPLEEDVYNIYLNKGDVFGAALETERVNINSFQNDGISFISLIKPNGDIVVTSESLNISQPDESPLPIKGNANISYVAPETGNYKFLVVGEAGEYNASITANSPGLELNKGQVQLIYLDFTGADITQREILGKEADIFEDFIGEVNPEFDVIRSLSPFDNFLENWGVENNARNITKLAKKITKVVAENLRTDLIESQINPNFDVIVISDYGSTFLGNKIPELLNRFKIPYSKVIIGGTIDEIGLRTIGRASTIDPGNYSLDDLAIVLLDLLSAEATNPNSLNGISLTEGASIEDLLAVGIGNVTSHEAGHFLGNFHTNNSNDTFSIMDQGGNLKNFIGIPSGGQFGDANNSDVDFVLDSYAQNEFPINQGQNSTDVNTSYALSFFSKKHSKSKENQDFTIEVIKQLEEQVLASLDKQVQNMKPIIYPNPVLLNETSHISFNTSGEGEYKVELYNLTGKKVATIFEEELSNTREERKVLEFSPQNYNLTSGVYFSRINTPTGTNSYKVIIK